MNTKLKRIILNELKCKGVYSQKIKFDSFKAPETYYEIIKDILLNEKQLSRHQTRNCITHLGILTTQALVNKNEEFYKICLGYINHNDQLVRQQAVSYVIGKHNISSKFNFVKIGEVNVAELSVDHRINIV